MPPGDGFDRLIQMEAEVRELARQLSPSADPHARYEGHDPTGAVRVTVDPTGKVRDTSIHRTWRDRIDPAELGTAVRQAVNQAVTARFTAWGEAVAGPEARPTGQDAAPPGGEAARVLQADPPAAGFETDRMLSELLSILEQLEAGFDTVTSQARNQLATAYTGRSPSGHAAVSVDGGGQVVGVEYDQRWLPGAGPNSIGSETRQAFEAAYELAAPHGADSVVAESPFGELQRLATDPVALAHRLGLRPSF